MSRSRPNPNKTLGSTSFPGRKGLTSAYSHYSMELQDYYSGWGITRDRLRSRRIIKRASRKTERQAFKKIYVG